jgi:hypothetical protein
MAEPEVEAAWRAELTRIHDTEAFQNGSDDPNAAFRGRVMKPKLGGSKRSAPTTTFGGPSLALSLL